MLNCRQVTRLLSQSMDAKLPWHKRLGMRVHLLYCVWCRRYAAQLHILRKASQNFEPQTLETPAQTLSREAKDQLRSRLAEAVKKLPPTAQ